MAIIAVAFTGCVANVEPLRRFEHLPFNKIASITLNVDPESTAAKKMLGFDEAAAVCSANNFALRVA
jgi:hypothetical protein